jgi:hypothetical protein
MRVLGTRFAAAMGAGALAAVLWWGASAVKAHAEDAPETAKAPATAAHQYVGVKKCKMCHKSEKSGAQYTKWTESKHSKAYETLASDKAKELAAKKGIDDPQKSPECLQCHVTGYGKPADQFAAAFVEADGVQCEACHGPGKDYVSRKTMKGITDGSLKAADYGLILPTKERCVECHNDKSPSFVSFDFSADSTKIAHPIPEEYKKSGGGGEEEEESK